MKGEVMAGTLIIGAGQAAVETAFGLRSHGYTKPIEIIGEEPYEPYQRPPLSKGYLLGEIGLERLFFKETSIYKENNIGMHTNKWAERVDRDKNIVVTQDGSQHAYENLVISTGSRPRMIPLEGSDSKNIFSLRSIHDIHSIKDFMQTGKKLAIIGGGYIGLELAAVGAKLGLDVSVVEMMPRLLARVARAQTAERLHKIHEKNGVKILLETGVNGIVTKGNEITALALSDGTELAADFVVVGIGAVPNQELAEQAGLRCGNGIFVNGSCQTSDEHIYAAGDVTRFEHPRYGEIRLESVGNAIDQAQRIAKAITQQQETTPSIPWFWSDQYDQKMQAAGLVMHDNIEILYRAGEKDNAQSLWIYDDIGLLSVEAINDPRAYLMGKRWLEQGQSPDKNAIIDSEINLKKCPLQS